jgi:hypothetical protein
MKLGRSIFLLLFLLLTFVGSGISQTSLSAK